MAAPTIFKEYSSPNQVYVDNREQIRLSWGYYSPDNKPQQNAEVRWKRAYESDDYFSAVSQTGTNGFLFVPPMTFNTPHAWVWEVRVFDGTEWSGWTPHVFEAGRHGAENFDAHSASHAYLKSPMSVGRHFVNILVVSNTGMVAQSSSASIVDVYDTITFAKTDASTWKPVVINYKSGSDMLIARRTT